MRLALAVSITWLAFIALACAPARAAENYLTTPGEAARAIGRLAEAAGPLGAVHTIRITDGDVTLLAKGGTTTMLDEWRIRQAKWLFVFETEVVSGPNARQPPATVRDLASGFFTLGDVPVDTVEAVVAKARRYARLEGEAEAHSIEIARRVHLLPTPSYGDIRWTIYLTSPNESATVYADAAGTIIGGDLSNTARAQRMDFLKDDDWPKESALESLTDVIGRKPIVRDITIYPKSVQVKADHPTIPEATVDYTWDLSGVSRSGFTAPMFPGTAEKPALSLADVDFSHLAKVRSEAEMAWGNSKSSMGYMMLRLFSDGPGKPEPRWTVSFTDQGQPGEMTFLTGSGTIYLSDDGKVRATNLPSYRRPKRDWLDPVTTQEMLEQIAEEFGKNARFATITVSPQAVGILAERPDQPGTMQDFNLNDSGLTASSMMMPWEAEFRPERLFRLGDLAAFTPEKLDALTKRTFERLQVGNEMTLARLTFSVGQLPTPDGSFMVPSPDGKVTLEIRLEDASGFKGGRVTYTSTGEEFDIVMP